MLYEEPPSIFYIPLDFSRHNTPKDGMCRLRPKGRATCVPRHGGRRLWGATGTGVVARGLLCGVGLPRGHGYKIMEKQKHNTLPKSAK